MPSTAYLYWDSVWRDSQRRQEWEAPSPWVVTSLARSWSDAGVRTVLDLGCGIGRHTLALSKLGFALAAIDKSSMACRQAQETCAGVDPGVVIMTGDFRKIPFADRSFDAVLAFNVVYHGCEDDLLACVAEVRRVLRPSGRYASTMLSKRNIEYGKGIKVDRNTFVQPDAQDDKVHPHLFCNAADVVRLHAGLELLNCWDSSQASDGSFHWHCEFEQSESS